MKIVEKAKTVTIGGPKLKLPKKGYTKIELKNVYTGEKQVYEDENMMTNAIEKYFSNGGLVNILPNSEFIGTNMYESLLGGIALFDSELEEDPDILYPYGAIMTANGCLNVTNSGNPLEMGTYNPLKSGWIDGKWVQTYDWNQDHGNGNIACACLTSYLGGFYGFGNKSGTRRESSNYNFLSSKNLGNTIGWSISSGRFCYKVDANGVAYMLRRSQLNGANHSDIVVDKVLTTLGEINVYSRNKIIETINVSGTAYIPNIADTSDVLGCYSDGKLYLISHNPSQWTSSNKVRIVELSENGVHEYLLDPPESGIYYYPYYYKTFIYKGYAYIPKCTSYNTTTGDVYKIKLSDLSLDSILSQSNTWQTSFNSFWYSLNKGVWIRDNGNYILNLEDETLMQINGYGVNSSLGKYGDHALKTDNPLFMFCSFDSNDYTNLYRHMYYIASINNLETPVTKTSDKTMTVSYTVTFD